MSISRHLDQYCAEHSVVLVAEIDTEEEGGSVVDACCAEFLPTPGIEVVQTNSGMRIESARALLVEALNRNAPV